jgi:hypothetical protein
MGKRVLAYTCLRSSSTDCLLCDCSLQLNPHSILLAWTSICCTLGFVRIALPSSLMLWLEVVSVYYSWFVLGHLVAARFNISILSNFLSVRNEIIFVSNSKELRFLEKRHWHHFGQFYGQFYEKLRWDVYFSAYTGLAHICFTAEFSISIRFCQVVKYVAPCE